MLASGTDLCCNAITSAQDTSLLLLLSNFPLGEIELQEDGNGGRGGEGGVVVGGA